MSDNKERILQMIKERLAELDAAPPPVTLKATAVSEDAAWGERLRESIKRRAAQQGERLAAREGETV